MGESAWMTKREQQQLFVENWNNSVGLMNELENKDISRDEQLVKALHALVYAVLALGMGEKK